MDASRGWGNVRGARLPATSLDALATLRREPGISIAWEPGRPSAWVEWDSTCDPGPVLRSLLPVHGVALYENRDGTWYPFGRALPAWDVPPAGVEAIRLDRGILPGSIAIIPPPDARLAPVELRLVTDHHPRRASAALGRVEDLANWAQTATSTRIESLEAACVDDLVLVRSRLSGESPSWLGDRRFWGRDVLIPLGFRVEPDLGPEALAEALGLQADPGSSPEPDPARQIAVLDGDGVEWIEASAFRRLTRAGSRLSAIRVATARAGAAEGQR